MAFVLLAAGLAWLFAPIFGGDYEGGEQAIGMMFVYGVAGILSVAFALAAILLKKGKKVIAPYIAIGGVVFIPPLVFLVAWKLA